MSPELAIAIESYDERICLIRWNLATAKIAPAEYRIRIDSAREELLTQLAIAAATEQMGT